MIKFVPAELPENKKPRYVCFRVKDLYEAL